MRISKSIGEIVVSVTFLTLSNTLAQDSIIRGNVIDQGTKEPIPMVNIYLRGSARGTTTDTHGRASLSVPSDKMRVISFSHIAYKKDSYDLKLEEGQPFDVTVELEPRTIGLSEVTVTGRKSFEEVTAARVITELEIEQLAPQNLEDILRWRAPNLLWRTSLASIRGQREFTLYWNGMRMMDLNSRDIDPYVVEKILIWRSSWAPMYYRSDGSRYVVDIRTKF